MDEEFQKRLADYFTGPELLDLLDVPVEELVSLLWDPYILEKKEELSDYTNFGS